ncbi:hypothetical protein [Vibrio harveyi]|uniref:hypothetical protein n=1 Tax=Vibrio harveyi TaxID=669 RepID=UPI003D712E62
MYIRNSNVTLNYNRDSLLDYWEHTLGIKANNCVSVICFQKEVECSAVTIGLCPDSDFDPFLYIIPLCASCRNISEKHTIQIEDFMAIPLPKPSQDNGDN